MTGLSPMPLLRGLLQLAAAWAALAVIFEVAMLGPRIRGEAAGGQTLSFARTLATDPLPPVLARSAGLADLPATPALWRQGLLSAGLSSARVTLTAMGITLAIGPVLGVAVARFRRWPLFGPLALPWLAAGWVAPFWLAALAVWGLVEFWGQPGLADAPPAQGGPVQWETLWRSGLIAAIVSLTAIGWQIRHLTDTLLEQARAPHVRAAQLRGLSGGALFFRHVFRNSLESVARCPDRSLPALLGMQMLVEWTFRYPGLGRLMIDSARTGHPAGLFGVTFLLASAVVFARWIGAGLHSLIDRSPSP